MSAQTLVVGVELAALPVGDDRPTVADTALRFDLADHAAVPWLGRHVEPGPFEEADAGLPCGVHLHWPLPPALSRTRAREGSDALEVPRAPDRWCVTRWGGGTRRSWVVESDRLWSPGATSGSCREQNARSGTVAHLPADLDAVGPQDVLHRRLGRVFDAEGWAEAAGPVERLAPLTALGPGVPDFAASYGRCPNVFGLWDPLDDVELDRLTLSYRVVGWFSGGDPPGQARDVGWAPGPAPARTRLRGELAGVRWERAATRRVRPATDDLRVAVAPTVGQATATLLAADLEGTTGSTSSRDQLEDLLDVVGLGQAGRLTDPRPGLRKAWDDARADAELAVLPGGTTWTLRPAPAAAPPTADAITLPGATAPPAAAAPPTADAITLPTVAAPPAAAARPPEALTIAVDGLEQAQRAADATERDLAGGREELFVSWCHLLELRPVDQPRRYDPAAWRLLRRQLAGLEQLVVAAQTAQADLVTARADAKLAATDTGWVSAEAPAAPFRRPNDPALALRGAGVLPAPRLDEAPRWATEEDDPARDAWTRRPPGPRTAEGRSTAWADARSWRPILLDWQAIYVDDVPRDAAGEVRADALFPETEPPPPEPRAGEVLTGTTALAPAPLGVLAAHARRLHAELPAAAATGSLGELLQAAASHESAPMLAQPLGGLIDALAGRRRSLELPVLDPHAPDAHGLMLGRAVRAGVAGHAERGPRAGGWHPLVDGRLRLTRLRLVDAFGRTAELLREAEHAPDAALAPADVAWPQRHAVRAVAGQGRLGPALVQPLRLVLRPLPPAPGASPVLGWLLTQRLGTGLAVHAPDGRPLGTLAAHGPLWQGTPGEGYGTDWAQAHLPQALRALLDPVVRAATDDENRQPLTDLVDAMDRMLEDVLPAAHADHGGIALLTGRPLALVRAELALELAGPADTDPTLATFRRTVAGTRGRRGGIPGLRVPVSLGIRDHLDDGLIGILDPDQAALRSEANGPVAPVELTPGGPAVELALVLDPRAPVHATAPGLASTTLSLPPEAWAGVLESMPTILPAGPLLVPATPEGPLHLPVPDEPGRTWSLVTAGAARGFRDDEWTTRAVVGLTDPGDGLDAEHTLVDGWLRLLPVEEPDA